jgi:hypothetical protein
MQKMSHKFWLIAVHTSTTALLHIMFFSQGSDMLPDPQMAGQLCWLPKFGTNGQLFLHLRLEPPPTLETSYSLPRNLRSRLSNLWRVKGLGNLSKAFKGRLDSCLYPAGTKIFRR